MVEGTLTTHSEWNTLRYVGRPEISWIWLIPLQKIIQLISACGRHSNIHRFPTGYCSLNCPVTSVKTSFTFTEIKCSCHERHWATRKCDGVSDYHQYTELTCSCYQRQKPAVMLERALDCCVTDITPWNRKHIWHWDVSGCIRGEGDWISTQSFKITFQLFSYSKKYKPNHCHCDFWYPLYDWKM